MAMQYRAVDSRTSRSQTWKSFFKQLHVSSGVWTLSFVYGLGTGAPTVFVPQIRKEWNSTAVVDDELASWFYTTSNFAAMAWIWILPALSHYVGKKIPYLACSILMSICFVLLYFSSAPYHILIAQPIQGFVNAGLICIIINIIPEYCNHRYRSLFLNIQITTFYWGIWVSNAIGAYFNWKYIPIVGLICSVYLFSTSFYPESPRWLASKGKFEECEIAHRWMHGCGSEAEKELRDLIESQANNPGKDSKMICSVILETLTYKSFYMPLLIIIAIGIQYNFSGKFVCSIYAIDILKKITKNEDTAYMGMLILDGVTVFGMYVGSVLPKLMKMRPLYLILAFVSIGMMFILSLYLYLVKLGVIGNNNIVTLSLLAVYSLATSSGPIMVSFTVSTEVISIRYQAVSFFISSFIVLIVSTAILKFNPLFLKEFGAHGSFFFFALSSGIITILLYIYIPETKNKTLVEIEEYFKDKKRSPEAKSLINEMKCETSHRKLNTQIVTLEH